MKRNEENRSVIEPSCTFFIPNKINFLSSNRVLDRKPDRVTGYKVLIDFVWFKKGTAGCNDTSVFFLSFHYFKVLYFNYNCKDSVE